MVNRFIIVFLSLSLIGCFGGGSSSTVIALPDSTVLNSGTSLTYNSSNAATMAAEKEFTNFNWKATSTQNPLEVINAHKAYGYGLTGSGQTIAIMDTGLSTSHQEFDVKTITTYGTLDYADGTSVSNDHGLFVAGVAAAENDDSDVGAPHIKYPRVPTSGL